MKSLRRQWGASVCLAALGTGCASQLEPDATTVRPDSRSTFAAATPAAPAPVRALDAAPLAYGMRKPEKAVAPRDVSPDDVIIWTARGQHDESIIDRIERSGSIIRLRGADENRLRDAGVSEDVIRAMKDTTRR